MGGSPPICLPLPKAAKPVWVEHLAKLSCYVVFLEYNSTKRNNVADLKLHDGLNCMLVEKKHS